MYKKLKTRLLMGSLIIALCSILAFVIGGYLVYTDPDSIRNFTGKDTVHEWPGRRFVILKSHSPERLFLYDRGKREVLLDNVVDYTQQDSIAIVMNEARQVKIDLETGQASLSDR